LGASSFAASTAGAVSAAGVASGAAGVASGAAAAGVVSVGLGVSSVLVGAAVAAVSSVFLSFFLLLKRPLKAFLTWAIASGAVRGGLS
jgi:hypothetical protein